MNTLREIASDLNFLFARYNQDAELTDDERMEIEQKLDALSTDRSVKLDSIWGFVEHDEAESERLKKEIERLTKWKKQHDDRAAWMEHYVSVMLNGERVETDWHKFFFKASEAVIVTDETAVPDEYRGEVKRPSPSLTKIKEALRAGQSLPWAYLEQRKNLQVK